MSHNYKFKMNDLPFFRFIHEECEICGLCKGTLKEDENYIEYYKQHLILMVHAILHYQLRAVLLSHHVERCFQRVF